MVFFVSFTILTLISWSWLLLFFVVSFLLLLFIYLFFVWISFSFLSRSTHTHTHNVAAVRFAVIKCVRAYTLLFRAHTLYSGISQLADGFLCISSLFPRLSILRISYSRLYSSVSKAKDVLISFLFVAVVVIAVFVFGLRIKNPAWTSSNESVFISIILISTIHVRWVSFVSSELSVTHIHIYIHIYMRTRPHTPYTHIQSHTLHISYFDPVTIFADFQSCFSTLNYNHRDDSSFSFIFSLNHLCKEKQKFSIRK